MRLGVFIKQPGETRQVAFSYSDAMLSSDTVDTAEVTSVAPVGLIADQITTEPGTVYFWLSGGAAGTRYTVTITTTTAAGEVFEDELYVQVKEFN